MDRGYEIIVSQEDFEDKKALGIEYPLYKDKYLDIVRILLTNCKRIQQNMREDLDRNKELFNAYERFPNDMSNIISIVGGRGTGKTTVLQEMRTIFMDFGNARSEIKEKWVKRLGMPHLEELGEFARQPFRISAMEVIDASALEEQDDLLEIILWHICDDVRKKLDSNMGEDRYETQGYKRQKFLETLDEVYRMHQNVKGKSDGSIRGESVLTALENMPNSIKTRNAMHKLLDLYCEIMFPGKEQSTYLVIAIDDLDLNITKSYQILEEIRRYLLDWRIIILLAVDNKQMGEVCITHFYNEFGANRNSSVDNDLAKHIHNLSNSYLLKTMTTQNRVYLSEENLRSAKIIEKYNEKREPWAIKEYILYNIAKKMHIYYDAYGLKTHFCEPSNIRELISNIEFLNSLHSVEWNVPEEEQRNTEQYLEQQLKYYNQNYIRFCQDIAERMAFQIMHFEQQDIFLEIRKRDLERRVGYTIQWYRNSPQRKGIPRAIEEMEHYDFGEFLGCIYNWGRKDYEYKSLVHCLIASFTTEMTKEYFNYHYNLKDKDSAKHLKRKLKGYVGDNVSGGWLSEGMGSVFWMEKVKEKRIKENRGDNRDRNAENKSVQISEEEYEYVDQENHKFISIDKEKELQYIQFEFEINNSAQPKKENHFIQILKKITESNILPILECLLLCLSNYKETKSGSERTPEIVIERKEKLNKNEKVVKDSKVHFAVKIQGAQYADFDIFGFVKKSIDYQEWRDKIGKQLIEAFIEQAEVISGQKAEAETLTEPVKKAIYNFEKTSLFAEGVSTEMALPLYNLDLSYNVLKRVRRKCRKEFSTLVEINNVLDMISKIYDLIEKELWHEEEQYNKIMQSENKFKYKEIFINDPYIKKFRNLASNELIKPDFLKYMKILYLGSGKLQSLEQISPNLEM